MADVILNNYWVMLLMAAWTLPWKGVALWKAARNGQKIWFVVLIVVNTLAALEIVYIFFFSKKKSQQLNSQNA
jgi:methionyl-tRNA synthetase